LEQTLTVHGGLYFTKAGPQSGYSIVNTLGTTSIDAGWTLQAKFGYSQTGGTLQTNGAGPAFLKGVVQIHGGDVKIAVTPAGAAQATGTLKCDNAVTMDGGTFTVKINSQTLAADQWLTFDNFTAGGSSTLTVTSFNGAIPANQTFTIVTSALFSGNFTTRNLAGLTWKITNNRFYELDSY
jgi:hypothetical protein